MQNGNDSKVVFLKGCQSGQNKKGGDRIQMYFKQDQACVLLEELHKQINNPRGVKIDLNSKMVDSDKGSFPAFFCFVKGVQERQNYANPAPQAMPNTIQPTEHTTVTQTAPTNNQTHTDVQATIARLKQEAANAKQST